MSAAVNPRDPRTGRAVLGGAAIPYRRARARRYIAVHAGGVAHLLDLDDGRRPRVICGNIGVAAAQPLTDHRQLCRSCTRVAGAR